MILHIIPREKFENDYITRINSLFNPAEHLFFVHGLEDKYGLPKLDCENVIYADSYLLILTLLWKTYSIASKIIVHGLPSIRSRFFLITLFVLDFIFHKPVAWAIWGGDLYADHRIELTIERSPKNCLKRFKIFLRKRLISRIKIAVVATDEDYENLVRWYKTNAKKFFATYHYDLMMPPTEDRISSNDSKINVMVGHCAFDNCQHIETFKLLEKYKGRIRIYSPLSYGDKKYAEKVIQAGNDMFGSDFIALTEYMNSTDYTKFLSAIDVGFFNNNQQHGNGNIVRMLYLGKKLFISPQNSLYKTYRDNGAFLYLFPSEFSDETFFTPFTDEQKKACTDAINSIYSDESFRRNWEAVFNALKGF